MSAELFPTITGQHWREMFAEFRASGRTEGSLWLRNLREMVQLEILRRGVPTAHAEGGAGLGIAPVLTGDRRPAADSFLQGRSVEDRESHKLEAAGSIPAPASNFTAVGRLAEAGRLGDHRIQGTGEEAHAHAGSGEKL